MDDPGFGGFSEAQTDNRSSTRTERLPLRSTSASLHGIVRMGQALASPIDLWASGPSGKRGGIHLHGRVAAALVLFLSLAIRVPVRSSG